MAGPVLLPEGWRLEPLRREHPRKGFRSGQGGVDRWLATLALHQQEKRLSATKALIDADGLIAGYYTLATGQVDFGDLPAEVARHLPKRMLPVAVLAWLGVRADLHGRGLGRLLLALALRDFHEASRTFAFVAVVVDCVDDAAKAFYRRFDFEELPGRPYRLFLSAGRLAAMTEKG